MLSSQHHRSVAIPLARRILYCCRQGEDIGVSSPQGTQTLHFFCLTQREPNPDPDPHKRGLFCFKHFNTLNSQVAAAAEDKWLRGDGEEFLAAGEDGTLTFCDDLEDFEDEYQDFCDICENIDIIII